MGYCHRDIKPHNILIERRDRSEINDLTEDPRTSILSPITELSDEDIEASEWVNPTFMISLLFLTLFSSHGKIRTMQC